MSRITHWALLLPEVGNRIIDQANVITAMLADEEHLHKSRMAIIEKAEAELEECINQEYSSIEVMQAKKNFYLNHADGSLQPVFQSDDNLECYTMPKNGKKIFISSIDQGFLNALRMLPPELIIKIMRLSLEDISRFSNECHLELRNKAIDLLGKKWYWRETGDLCKFHPYECEALFGIADTKQAIMRKVRSGKLSLEQLKKIIDYLEPGMSNCELYQKD